MPREGIKPLCQGSPTPSKNIMESPENQLPRALTTKGGLQCVLLYIDSCYHVCLYIFTNICILHDCVLHDYPFVT